MQKLVKSGPIDYYVMQDDFDVIAHTIGKKNTLLLSLANVEEKIREWDEDIVRESAFLFSDGSTRTAYFNGIKWAKKHYKIQLPDTFEVETEVNNEILMITRIIRAI